MPQQPYWKCAATQILRNEIICSSNRHPELATLAEREQISHWCPRHKGSIVSTGTRPDISGLNHSIFARACTQCLGVSLPYQTTTPCRNLRCLHTHTHTSCLSADLATTEIFSKVKCLLFSLSPKLELHAGTFWCCADGITPLSVTLPLTSESTKHNVGTSPQRPLRLTGTKFSIETEKTGTK